jgi:Ni/Co efflux regulator RcnB
MTTGFEKRLDGVLNALSLGRGNQIMNSKRGLMSALVGLAILATPMAAAAKDYNHYDSHAAHVSRNVARAVRNDAVANHDFRANRAFADAHAYRNYGYANRGYYGAPAYAAPAYAGGYGGYAGGNGCGNAARVINTYDRDRNTGHPAAAYDLLAQNRWAFRSGCGGGAPVGGGMLGGLVPSYNNYGGGGGLLSGLAGYRGTPAYGNNGGLLGGLGGYRGTPAYGNNGGLLGGLGGYRGATNGAGYNGGYGQPAGGNSMLGNMLQYIR